MHRLLDYLFHLKGNETTVRRELLAGTVSFFTMVYIVVVNSSILADAGIPLEAGIVATVLASVTGCLLMAVWANRPLLLVPGMGINALFAYTLVHSMGLSWQEALAAVFTAGIVFAVVSFTPLAHVISSAIPRSLKEAITAGIGLFLAFIGLQKGGVIILDQETFVALGPLSSPQILLTIFTLLLTLVLFLRQVPGSFLISIAAGTLLTALAGQIDTDGLNQSSSFSLASYDSVFAALSFERVGSVTFWIAAFSIALVVIFESIGVIHSQLQLLGKPESLSAAMRASAVSVITCGLWGTSPTVSAAESVAGISAGGKTGLTSLTTGLLFLLSLLLLPVVTLIPESAIAPVLVVVGGLMMQGVRHLPFDDLSEWFPAFLTIALIPLTYSIVDGMGFGFVAYPLLKWLLGKGRDVSVPLYVIAGLFVVYFGLQAVGV
ncbi:NCS2 family permease [Brevibacillus humidisoli]|uniref:NCS2 family permease n=1 Tax=Brevibacillus humidisoli TaxID=2895522 RepID=UPI001E30A501|nr:NCS2 family permease [Brevibacillus humidisoli]UFJ39320.1 NCS2 family permease [Brevibacillus humidisoli]